MPEDPNATASQGTPVFTPAPPARAGEWPATTRRRAKASNQERPLLDYFRV